MKTLVLALSLLVTAAGADGFPSAPFTFIGIPEKIRDGSYETVHGRVRSVQIKVVEVKKGPFKKSEIGFDFPEGSEPPLEIGRTYRFTAVYDRHGIRYTDWKEEEPNKRPEPMSSCAPPRIITER